MNNNNKDSKHMKYIQLCNSYIKSLDECERKDKILNFNRHDEFHCRLIKQLYDGCLEFDKIKNK